MAPEILRQEWYGMAADWWSLGILLFEMLVGLTPYSHRNIREQQESILRDPIVFPPHIEMTKRF